MNDNQKMKKTVTKIQKDKVKFNPSTQNMASKTLKFDQGALSKMTIATTKDKFETIINSAGLRGLIMNPILGKTQSQPQPNSPVKRSSSGSTLRRMKSENIFGSNARGSEGNHSQNARIEVPKVVKAIHNEKSAEDGERSPIISTDQIEIEIPSNSEGDIQLLNLKNQPSSSEESSGASSRISKSLLLDNFLSKSKERLTLAGNSISPKQKNSNSNSTAANSNKSSQENSYE